MVRRRPRAAPPIESSARKILRPERPRSSPRQPGRQGACSRATAPLARSLHAAAVAAAAAAAAGGVGALSGVVDRDCAPVELLRAGRRVRCDARAATQLRWDEGGEDGRGKAAAPHLTVEGVAGGGSARGILPAGRRGLVGSTHARQKYGAGSEAAQPRFGRPALREPRVGIYANDAGPHRPPVPNFSVRERFVLWAGGNSRCSAKHAEHA